ncbi:MAG: type IV pilin protein [Patescibacteria group bacterium]|nr:type IV pilin protein [Patescibacteria group bacterium]
MLKQLKNNKGFTLIELLIVIVIIGILAGIVIGLTGVSARRKSRDAQRKSDIHEIQNALEQYFVDKDVYPADLNTLTTTTPPLLQAPVKTQPDGVAYTYTPANANRTYTLSAPLENTNDTGPNVVGGNYQVTNKQ